MSEFYPFRKRAEHDFLNDVVTAIVALEASLASLRADERVIIRKKVEGVKEVINKYYARHVMKTRKDDEQ